MKLNCRRIPSLWLFREVSFIFVLCYKVFFLSQKVLLTQTEELRTNVKLNEAT